MDAGKGPCCTPEEQLNQLISQYHTSMLKLCCMLLRDPVAAEDAVQETFLKAYRGIVSFRGQSSAKTWMTAIALNVCRDMRKSAWARHVEKRVTPEELPIAAPAQDEDALALGQAIQNLPDKYREAVLLYYYQDMTMQETAKLLKTTPSNIAKRLDRARTMLRKELEVTLP
ncbi:MAG: sigma-70 family RNA polymerase sigma factor [Clostridia bacterium]|nr:sigma-70 family RNA polymerase sigma factor [Clostridia bacterium]